MAMGALGLPDMLNFKCIFKNILEPSYFNQSVNLRIPFKTGFGIGWRNLQEAVGEAGLQWDGRLHCRLDDALNTARLLVKLMRRGVHISITGSSGATASSRARTRAEAGAGAGAGVPTSTTASLVHRNLRLVDEGATATDCSYWPTATDCSYCYCGIPIRGGMVTIPGPMQARFFFIRGNWMPTCCFFFWAA
jgi:ERI1 exoribonuclease 2